MKRRKCCVVYCVSVSLLVRKCYFHATKRNCKRYVNKIINLINFQILFLVCQINFMQPDTACSMFNGTLMKGLYLMHE